MLVELIGPAGAGKTSTVKRAEALLTERGLDVLAFDELERLESEIGTRSFKGISGFKRRLIIGGLLMRRPDIVLPILMLSWLYGPEESTGSNKRRQQRTRRVLGHIRLMLSLRAGQQDRGAGQQDQVVLLHEGFTQVLWTLLIDSPALKATWLIRFVLARYHAAMGQRGVRIDVDDVTVMRRVFDRDDSGRFNRDSSERQRYDFPTWLGFHRSLVGLLPRRMEVVGIDGQSPSDFVAEELAAAVESFSKAADRKASAVSLAQPITG